MTWSCYFSTGIEGLGSGADHLASHGVPAKDISTDHRDSRENSSICLLHRVFSERDIIYNSPEAQQPEEKHFLTAAITFFSMLLSPEKKQHSYLAAIHSPGIQT